MNAIVDFSGQYRFLSNFYPAEIVLGGRLYPTLEHAYQSLKTDDQEMKHKILVAKTPGEAKRLGQRVVLKENWSKIRVPVMMALLHQKFSHPELKYKLMETDGLELIEGNNWGDTFWGCVWVKEWVNGQMVRSEWTGENHLGKLLMQLRKELLKWKTTVS